MAFFVFSLPCMRVVSAFHQSASHQASNSGGAGQAGRSPFRCCRRRASAAIAAWITFSISSSTGPWRVKGQYRSDSNSHADSRETRQAQPRFPGSNAFVDCRSRMGAEREAMPAWVTLSPLRARSLQMHRGGRDPRITPPRVRDESELVGSADGDHRVPLVVIHGVLQFDLFRRNVGCQVGATCPRKCAIAVHQGGFR